MIRNGVAFVALIFYWQIQALTGVLWKFIPVYSVMIGVYLVGRVIGLAWRAIWFVVGVLLAVSLYFYLVGGMPASP